MISRFFNKLTGMVGDVSHDAPLPVAGAFTAVGAHFSRSDLSTFKTLTPPAGACRLKLQAIDQNVRYTLDGTTPTSVVGFQIFAGDPDREIYVAPGSVVKVVEETATAALQGQWGK